MKLDNRIWIILTVLISGAVLAGAWFLGVSPFLSAASTTRDQVAQVEASNSATSAELASLKVDRGKLDSLQAKADTLTAAVPHALDATRFIEQVNAIAAASGVDVKSITVSAATAYTPTAPVTAGTPGAASSPSASPSPSPSASASAEAAAPAVPAGLAPISDPLITSTNFVVVPVTIVVGGSGSQTLAFLEGLQHGKRLVLVTSITTGSEDGGGSDLTIAGSIYVLKSTAAAAGASANG